MTGTDTALGAAVQAHFDASGAATVGSVAGRPDTAQLKGTARTVYADPANGAEIRDAVHTAAAVMGGLDTLVVAHPLPMVQPFGEQTMADFWHHVDSTLTGSFLYAQAAAEAMREAGTGGRIVLTTSKWHVGGQNLSAVATAAGGIVALTKTLTRDFGRFRIGVNAVAVGAVDSEWSVCDAVTGGALPPVGRVGTVEQVARVIGILCQQRLGAAVGQIVNVDGGLSRNRV
ncbi:SDR family NAD(P)-dependent oxidoreductase [Mycolicibacterium mengxianglii]|uniref:SDR family NAD(P)-dependent oxidoreductase n=1 Tax=Mycolicibacterium mengxianglii TaxID=2736649 RepID=UPI001E481D31|nr:SDR family oxidoreductase [Mycolicibacterium mengxianglii]